MCPKLMEVESVATVVLSRQLMVSEGMKEKEKKKNKKEEEEEE